MNDEVNKTLVRIERILDDVSAHVRGASEDSRGRDDLLDRLETLLERSVEEAEKQTKLLERLLDK